VTASSRIIGWVFGVVLAGIMALKALAIWTDYLWFQSLAQAPVFITMFTTRVALGLVVGLLFCAWLFLNVRLARKPLPEDIALIGKRLLPEEERAQVEAYADKSLLVFALIGGVMAGLVASGKWLPWLQYTHAVDFGAKDPLFGLDAGFYVFKLALLRYLYQTAFFGIVIALIASVLVHLYQEAIRVVGSTVQAIPRARAHVYILVALGMLVKIWGYRLDQLGLLMANRGGVFSGASYADVYGRLPVMYALMVLCLIGAGVMVASIRSRRLFLPAGALAVIILFSMLGGSAYPALVHKLVVVPTQLEKEKKFIEFNITATRAAFGLDEVKSLVHQVKPELTWDEVNANRATIDNVRLWDHRPLERTMDQTQALRAYYDFPDVDVDRYTVDGKYRQVMLAPRQVDADRIPPPDTWVKERLQYTHGYGICATPVNEIAHGQQDEGLPTYWVKDIPPVSVPGLEVKRPGVYFMASIHPRLIELIQSIRRRDRVPGPQDQQPAAPQAQPDNGGGPPGMGGGSPKGQEQGGGPGDPTMPKDDSPARLQDYVVCNTSEEELDYPKLADQASSTENANATTRYDGRGGIPVGSFLRRLAFCARYYDLQLLLTQSITKDSRILINRTLPERVQELCPFFLICDPDPYITVIDGQLKWINDAYTYSRMYPYSTIHKSTGVNYLRNSVKVVCDAYDGIPELYVVDPSDPMVKCYQSIFPSLFKAEPMPANVRAHIRYPQLQFVVQAEMYADYHMTNPATFYQREDSWSIAQEIYGAEPRMTEAYYVVMKIPGEAREEFVLMVPLTLRGREDRNMVAWMAARCDGENYGKLLCYRMPKSAWVDGPMQVESRIGQNRDFSAKQTLWSQRGSTIIRGNLLVIPLARTLLYVEPIYIASANSAIPELKLVVLVQGSRIALGNDLNDALAKLMGGPSPAGQDQSDEATLLQSISGATATPLGSPGPALPPQVKQLVDKALDLETQSRQALANGDLGGYQKLQAQQAELLKQMSGGK
jgi:uncharacterized protein